MVWIKASGIYGLNPIEFAPLWLNLKMCFDLEVQKTVSAARDNSTMPNKKYISPFSVFLLP